MKELEYPFDAEYIIKKKKSMKKVLLSEESSRLIRKNIAILGGETTQDIRDILDLFLLNYGIQADFYESEYNQWYEDGMFPNKKLESFAPDIIYICTCIRNITKFPMLSDDKSRVEEKLCEITDKFTGLWNCLSAVYQCPIIQNNFEYPYFRLMGNKDASDIHGRVNFVTALNSRFYEYAQTHDNFYICDINYLSGTYGLDRWSDPFYWHMYKYAVAVPAIPYLSFNVANMIKSIYGKNKKAFNLDLDNTLWGGIVGDDGAENIEIGQETPLSQAYSEFQEYLKLHKQMGILLTINSKNDGENAISGLERPDSVLHKEDFVNIKANWESKHRNLVQTASELSLLPESFVFVDDNPAEREIVAASISGVAVPHIDTIEHSIQTIDRSGYFEATLLSQDDLRRNEMYEREARRNKFLESFLNYEEYLLSLEMRAEIQSFLPVYMARIAQLTNKSNQFNLTTKRYSQSDMEAIANDPAYLTLYGRLMDKFGDNGVVSILIGKICGKNREELHIELWLMSCRVLKRNMEYAMMDELVSRAQKAGIKRLIGYYYPTAKNSMVRDFYAAQGFTKMAEDEFGNTTWEFMVNETYDKKQNVIEIIDNLTEKGKGL